MKFGVFSNKQRKFTTKRGFTRTGSVEDYGRDQLKELAKKGLSFQIVVL